VTPLPTPPGSGHFRWALSGHFCRAVTGRRGRGEAWRGLAKGFPWLKMRVMAELFCPRCSRPLPPGATACPACGQPIAAATGDRGAKWVIFAVIGAGCLLVALFVGGIVAALVIPNFLDALQKAKQKRTVADLRNLGTALQSYATDHDQYPEGADTAAVVSQLVAGNYLAADTASQDGWKHPLRWSCLDEDGGSCRSFELASPGRDGTFESEPGGYEASAFAPTAYDSDIVLSDGLFVRWPENQGRYGLAPAGGDDG
jgi:type II secretory pathway pseudopilin PulG